MFHVVAMAPLNAQAQAAMLSTSGGIPSGIVQLGLGDLELPPTAIKPGSRGAKRQTSSPAVDPDTELEAPQPNLQVLAAAAAAAIATYKPCVRAGAIGLASWQPPGVRCCCCHPLQALHPAGELQLLAPLSQPANGFAGWVSWDTIASA